MRIEEHPHARGDRLQNELFAFLVGDTYLLDPATIPDPDFREVVALLRQVRGKMAADHWFALLAGKRSAADIAKIDVIIRNDADGRYFVLDFTVNEEMEQKHSSSTLYQQSVVRITTNEDERVDIETKRAFLEGLLHLMDSPSLLNMQDTPYPSLSADLSWGEKAEELETFIRRLESKAGLMEGIAQQGFGDPEAARTAVLLRQYCLDLVRQTKFVKGEHAIATNQDHIDQQVQFMRFCTLTLPRAAKLALTNQSGFEGQRQRTHEALYHERFNQLQLKTPELIFRIPGISGLAIAAIYNATSKVRQQDERLYTRKRMLIAKNGREVIDILIRLIDRTPVQQVLGPTYPIPEPTNVQKRRPGKK